MLQIAASAVECRYCISLNTKIYTISEMIFPAFSTNHLVDPKKINTMTTENITKT